MFLPEEGSSKEQLLIKAPTIKEKKGASNFGPPKRDLQHKTMIREGRGVNEMSQRISQFTPGEGS